MSTLLETGWTAVTVSELVTKLAGLPPMMEIYVNAEGESLFLNQGEIEEQAGSAPFFRLVANKFPFVPEPPKIDVGTYEEKLAKQRQRQMEMTHQSQESEKAPEAVVDP